MELSVRLASCAFLTLFNAPNTTSTGRARISGRALRRGAWRRMSSSDEGQ